jgi:hypothetical protein
MFWLGGRGELGGDKETVETQEIVISRSLVNYKLRNLSLTTTIN